MKWLKHDSDANMDFKLQQLLLDYGLEGYGLYWYCLELIVNKVDVGNITFRLEHDSRIIARNTGSTVQRIEEMMKRLVELKLFEHDGKFITCIKIAKRLDKSMTSNNKMRLIIDQIKTNSHDSIMITHDSIMTKSDFIMQEEKRREEIRESAERDSKPRRFVAPTLEEVKNYCIERKNGIDPQRFLDFYETNGWMQGKKKIVSWKACVRTWEKNNTENNPKEFSIDDLAR